MPDPNPTLTTEDPESQPADDGEADLGPGAGLATLATTPRSTSAPARTARRDPRRVWDPRPDPVLGRAPAVGSGERRHGRGSSRCSMEGAEPRADLGHAGHPARAHGG